MAFVHYNPNPEGKNVGDCTVRALSRALGQDWEHIYTTLAAQGYLMGDMPSANHVWGAILRREGFKRRILPDDCPDCYTVADFAGDHPHGVYVLALSGHVVALCDGDWCDSWDSGSEIPLYYWTQED